MDEEEMDYDEMDEEQLQALMEKEEAEAEAEMARLEAEMAKELQEEQEEDDLLDTDRSQFSQRRNMFEEEATNFVTSVGEEKKRRKKAAKQLEEDFDIEDALSSVDLSKNIENAREAEQKRIRAREQEKKQLDQKRKEIQDKHEKELGAIEQAEKDKKRKKELKAERKRKEKEFITAMQEALNVVDGGDMLFEEFKEASVDFRKKKIGAEEYCETFYDILDDVATELFPGLLDIVPDEAQKAELREHQEEILLRREEEREEREAKKAAKLAAEKKKEEARKKKEAEEAARKKKEAEEKAAKKPSWLAGSDNQEQQSAGYAGTKKKKNQAAAEETPKSQPKPKAKPKPKPKAEPEAAPKLPAAKKETATKSKAKKKKKKKSGFFEGGEVTVSIPNFKQRIVGAATLFTKTKSVVFYNVHMHWRNTASKFFKPISWVVEARFSAMNKLHEHLLQMYPLVDLPNFPEKFGLVNTVNKVSGDKNGEAEFLEYRLLTLDSYFGKLITNEQLMSDQLVVRFLELREHVSEASKAAMAASKAAKEEQRQAELRGETTRRQEPAQAATKPKKSAKPAEPEEVPEEAFDDPLAWMAGGSDDE